jgi:hypothetical protein
MGLQQIILEGDVSQIVNIAIAKKRIRSRYESYE